VCINILTTGHINIYMRLVEISSCTLHLMKAVGLRSRVLSFLLPKLKIGSVGHTSSGKWRASFALLQTQPLQDILLQGVNTKFDLRCMAEIWVRATFRGNFL